MIEKIQELKEGANINTIKWLIFNGVKYIVE